MSMKLKLESLDLIEKSLRIDKNGAIQKFAQNTVYKAMDKYVPRSAGTDGGNLRETVDLSNPEYIIYEMPYAEYQYYGIRKDGTHVVMNYTTPNTFPYWDEHVNTNDINEIVRKVQQALEE